MEPWLKSLRKIAVGCFLVEHIFTNVSSVHPYDVRNSVLNWHILRPWTEPACISGKYDLRAIYTVRLCRLRQAHYRSTTRIVSFKSNLQLAFDCRVSYKKCRRILKSYDNRWLRHVEWRELCAIFCMSRSASALEIACDSRKQKLYRLNRPLGNKIPVEIRHSHDQVSMILKHLDRTRLSLVR